MKQFKAITDMVEQYSKKSTKVMVVSPTIHNVNIKAFYGSGFEYITGNINLSKEKTGIEVGWYSIERRDGFLSYYLTGNKKFTEFYPTDELVLNYFTACSFATNGLHKQRNDAFKKHLTQTMWSDED